MLLLKNQAMNQKQQIRLFEQIIQPKAPERPQQINERLGTFVITANAAVAKKLKEN
ncbi:hypothetical protein EfmJHP80_21040 [Enterococcus faecium]|nr:hypothetical protein EfmJHP80_21040 [Enterococcus faecium]